MSELIYSAWHRTLGYSYFATDVDFIEVRDNHPIAVIEASICTPGFPTCDGSNGVLNRFLRETGGFQLEVAWWTAKWLNVPAFVICIKDPDNLVHILSLVNGEQVSISTADYLSFINEMSKETNTIERTLTNNPLELYDLLNKLSAVFPGVGKYPYFANKRVWMNDYRQRLKEVANKVARVPPQTVATPPNYPIKGETTGGRPREYQNLRNGSSCDYFSVEWVEWRKDNPGQKIGRPAAILKTIPIDTIKYSEGEARNVFEGFKQSREFAWWLVTAGVLLVPFYSVVFEAISARNDMGDRFWVWEAINKQNQRLTQFTRQDYARFICGL